MLMKRFVDKTIVWIQQNPAKMELCLNQQLAVTGDLAQKQKACSSRCIVAPSRQIWRSTWHCFLSQHAVCSVQWTQCSCSSSSNQGLTGRVFQLRVGSGRVLEKIIGSGWVWVRVLVSYIESIGYYRVLKFLIGYFPILSYLTLWVLG